MPSLAKQVTKEQVVTALEHIIENSLELKGSTVHNLVYKGLTFPPKEVVRWAARLAEIPSWENMTLSGGDNTNEPLKMMGFDIVSKTSLDVNEELVKKYKLLSLSGNSNEIYKWQLIEKYKGKPELNAVDFGKEITSINYQNLIFHNGIAVRNHIAKVKPEEYRNAFRNLFNEEINLGERIAIFQDEIDVIYKSIGQTLHHHHDERSIATFLTFYKPDKYILYKNSFYSRYCKLLGIKQAKKNEKYIHYLSLAKTFLDNYVTNDDELMKIKAGFLTPDCYADPNNLIFLQDILYQSLDGQVDDTEIEDIVIGEQEETPTSNKRPLNQILYGPPGTGKTYHTINKALEIINDEEVKALDWSDRKAVKELYQKKVNAGQIVFTTFHQSISYEDFVEGIKPDLEEDKDGVRSVVYDIKDGIFKELCNKARVTPAEENDHKLYHFDDAWNELLAQVQNHQVNENDLILEILTPKKGLKVTEITNNGNLRLQPINSGSSALEYTVSYQRLKKLQKIIGNVADVKNIDKEFRAVIGGMNSTAYWAALNFINNWLNKANQIKLSKASIEKAVPHILIIDEINRGNVSAIFGELITLIEDSKRLGNEEALEITLPYSKSKFGVPENVYIIGTMNTADRSVESLDTALRRRFSFVEMLPNPDLVAPEKMVFDLWLKHATAEWEDTIWLKDEKNLYGLLGSDSLLQLSLDKKQEISASLDNEEVDETVFKDYFNKDSLNLKVILEKINTRLEKLLSRDHTIGHSFFLGITTVKDLFQVFYNKIIPLLQEYFFGDYGKIGLVLGSPFVTEVNVEASTDIFADFYYEDRDLLLDKKVYRINDFENNLDSFLAAVKAI